MLASGLTGCTGAAAPQPGAAPVAGTGAPVIVPGAPGDRGRVATPGERVGEPESGASAGDVLFTERMIPHHRQALEMAGLAPDRTTTAAVLGLCRRITAGQGPEIEVMSRWLLAQGQEVPAGHGHEPDPAYGMASLAEMNRLRAARGTEFDALLLHLMIRHHEGALRMAGEEIAQGGDQLLLKMAGDIASGQRAEIVRMRRLLN
ncbi:DUF305 domain-containing protein [Sphaerisporangium aureirubrum]|uniref:DUF305 domain-containing protein n=1 Tax=Sphaerisporangium aureirubrum TaxID=1544736 RepID=A0ABW1NF75_9ACTN